MPVGVRFTAVVPKRRRVGVNALVRKDLQSYVHSLAEGIKQDMQQYPPVPSDSRYVRTLRLQRNWRVTPTGTAPNIGYSISNATQYAPLVHGTITDPGRQFWAHTEHDWPTLLAVVERRGGRARFRRDTQAIITRNVRGGEI